MFSYQSGVDNSFDNNFEIIVGNLSVFLAI